MRRPHAGLLIAGVAALGAVAMFIVALWPPSIHRAYDKFGDSTTLQTSHVTASWIPRVTVWAFVRLDGDRVHGIPHDDRVMILFDGPGFDQAGYVQLIVDGGRRETLHLK